MASALELNSVLCFLSDCYAGELFVCPVFVIMEAMRLAQR